MGRGPEALQPERLLPFLERIGCRGRWCVAFSGGGDSTALLLALHELRRQLNAPLEAIHVNHGAHADADAWVSHCRSICGALSVPLAVVPAPESPLPPGSPEARLRAWRNTAFEALLERGDVLCTAHHREDQAETLLLALLRGSGPEGLAAMPEQRPLGAGRLVRPLLETPRAALVAYLRKRGVDWIDDPSNQDTSLDRNYLRGEILPRLRARWPAADRSLADSARLCGEAAAWLGAEADLALAGREPHPGVLRVRGLENEPAALRALLRRWLKRRNVTPLPRARLEALAGQLETAGPDRRIRVEWGEHRLRHHRGMLWLDGPARRSCPRVADWNGGQAADLGPLSGRLALDPPRALGPFRIDARAGGERYRDRAGGPSRTLKGWFAQLGLPPWFRDSVPLLFDDDRLLAAGDVVLDAAFRERLEQEETDLSWRGANETLAWAWRACTTGALTVK